MTTLDPKLAIARAKADRARAELMRSVHLLQSRAAPTRLANEAIETAKERGAVMVDKVAAAACRRPGLFAGAAAGILALVARRPIVRLIRRARRPKVDVLAPPPPSKRALPRPSGDRR